MNNVNSTNPRLNTIQYQKYSSYPPGPVEGLAASVLSGYSHALFTTYLKIGAKTGLTVWAVPQVLKNGSVLCSFPYFKQIFDSSFIAGGFSGLTEAVSTYALRGINYNYSQKVMKSKIREAHFISYQRPKSNLPKFAALVFSRSLYFATFFTVSSYFRSFLHRDQENFLSCLAKNVPSGAAGGAIGHIVSYPAHNLAGFKKGFNEGISRVCKNAFKGSYSAALLGAAIFTSIQTVEGLKNANNRLFK